MTTLTTEQVRGLAQRWALDHRVDSLLSETRALAAVGSISDEHDELSAHPDLDNSLTGYERKDLLAWVWQRMDKIERTEAVGHAWRWVVAETIAGDLGLPVQGACECEGPSDMSRLDEDGCCVGCGVDRFHDEDGEPTGPAHALCELAGWPS